MTKKQSEVQEAIERLRETPFAIKPGMTINCILRHVSRSGMRRIIQFVGFESGRPIYLGYNIAKAVGYTYDSKREGIIVDGCGSDMGFDVVYNLGRVMFPEGFAVKETKRCTKCQDRPGFDGLGRTCKTCGGSGDVTSPVRGRNGDMSGWDKDGGYALKSVWL